MPRTYYDEEYMALTLKERTRYQAAMCGLNPNFPDTWPLRYLHYMDFIFMCYTRKTYYVEWQKFMDAMREGQVA